MQFRVGVLLVAFGWSVPFDASADAYTFYQAQNHLTQPITFTAYESPREACEAAEGLLYTTSPVEFIKATEYFATGSQCFYRTESNAIQVGAVAPIAGTCSGDTTFSFHLQQCADVVDDAQIHAVLLAAFSWLCLIGGMLVGFKAGA